MAGLARWLLPSTARGALWLALGAGGALWGCSSETAGRGEACTRTAQCAAGLACVDGECSTDLAGLDDQGMVPMLMPEPGADAAADGGADAAAGAGGGAAAGAGGGVPPVGGAVADAGVPDDDAGQ